MKLETFKVQTIEKIQISQLQPDEFKKGNFFLFILSILVAKAMLYINYKKVKWKYNSPIFQRLLNS